ncbi:MAG: FAD-dependent oxidoreductase, partial [bacterium]|nr:FAD-dependent oxidoreductase [bacterium]
MEKFDVVVVGGGAGGIACAWNAAKNGLKTLLIEKNIHLGGLITSGLVIPVMKLNSLGINVEFYNELISVAKSQNACVTYEDGNSGWFNPELMKSVFDKMLSSVGCKVLFNTEISQVEQKND